MRRKSSKKISIASLLLLLVIAFFYFIRNNQENKSYALDNDKNILAVHYIDVGQGDATFIELPNKETMLIDAGEKSYGDTVTNYINNLGYEEIDYLVGTHPHTDHIGGLEKVIDSFKIENIYMPRVTSNTKTYLSLLEKIDSKNLTITTAKKGIEIISEDNLKIEILSPVKDEYKDLNNYSVVIKVTYDEASFLFMGDAQVEVENEILDTASAQVIKIGHHGSSTSSSKSFVNKVKPKYAIIEVGINNNYNHPNSDVVKRWENIGAIIYRTDLNGNIIAKSDGKNIVIEKEK